jgi:2-polyprenyl-6-methoxyphenol hydroxylase-like FAD-dependent oxidoreductase
MGPHDDPSYQDLWHYRIQMNPDGGDALQQALPDSLYELYLQTSAPHPRRELIVVIDNQGREISTLARPGPRRLRPGPHTYADRHTLLRILRAGLDGVVRYGRTVTGYRYEGDRVRVLLDDGDSAVCDVLVGADGLNSAVRRQLLPGAQIVDSGIRWVHGRAALQPEPDGLPATLRDAFAVAVDESTGTMLSFGAFTPRRPLLEAAAELTPTLWLDPVEPYLTISCTSNAGRPADAAALLTLERDQLRDRIVAATDDCHPAIRELAGRIEPYSCFVEPVRTVAGAVPWRPERVTVLGDAIHVERPTIFSGANTAMRDAALLAGKLIAVEHGELDLYAAIAQYEDDMRDYAHPSTGGDASRALAHVSKPSRLPSARPADTRSMAGSG